MRPNAGHRISPTRFLGAALAAALCLGEAGAAKAATPVSAEGAATNGVRRAEGSRDWREPELELNYSVAGPLVQSFPLTLEPGWRTEAAGPFYYDEERETDSVWAVAPFVSVLRSRDGERETVRVLPPVFTYRKYGRDMRWEVGQWFSGSRVDSIADKELKRFTIFPIFYYQGAPDPERRFWGLLPVYGTIRNRLGIDQIRFAGFPLWVETKKGKSTTQNILFPVGHVRSGPGLEGWKVWPLAGHEHQEPTTRTNVLDEVEVVPGHDTAFALWPLWYRDRLEIGGENPQRIDATLPLYYRQRSPQRDHTAVGWPFFSWSEDRAEKYRQWNAPWPFVSFARGEGKTLNRVLPLFNVGHTKTIDIESYAWPLYRRRHLHTPNMDRDRTQYGFYVLVDLKESNPETGQKSRRLDSWPLFAWSRDRSGNERLQVPALAEAFGRSPGIEANWSPLWSLWRQERNPTTGASSQSLLWNLYRRETREGSTKGSLLFGLVQYEKSPAGRRWRWFRPGAPLGRETRDAVPAADRKPMDR
jgi:hypothetical protein